MPNFYVYICYRCFVFYMCVIRGFYVLFSPFISWVFIILHLHLGVSLFFCLVAGKVLERKIAPRLGALITYSFSISLKYYLLILMWLFSYFFVSSTIFKSKPEEREGLILRKKRNMIIWVEWVGEWEGLIGENNQHQTK